jgi:hypothetical protein
VAGKQKRKVLVRTHDHVLLARGDATMDLDLETFLTRLYVRVDDLYQQVVRPQMPVGGRPTPRLSDSEVLCLGLATQWRSGVPRQSERRFLIAQNLR